GPRWDARGRAPDDRAIAGVSPRMADQVSRDRRANAAGDLGPAGDAGSAEVGADTTGGRPALPARDTGNPGGGERRGDRGREGSAHRTGRPAPLDRGE